MEATSNPGDFWGESQTEGDQPKSPAHLKKDRAQNAGWIAAGAGAAALAFAVVVGVHLTHSGSSTSVRQQQPAAATGSTQAQPPNGATFGGRGPGPMMGGRPHR